MVRMVNFCCLMDFHIPHIFNHFIRIRTGFPCFCILNALSHLYLPLYVHLNCQVHTWGCTVFYGAMAYWLRCWTANAGVPYSKPMGGSKVDSAFHPSEVNKMSTKNFWDLSGEK